MFFKKQKKFKYLKDIFEKHITDSHKNSNENLHFLLNLVAYFRPTSNQKNVSLEELLNYLSAHPSHCEILGNYLADVLGNRRFGQMISEVGILQDTDFFYELKKRLTYKILPFQPEKDTLEYVLNQVFFNSSDFNWIEKIPFEELEKLFQLLKFQSFFQQEPKRTTLNEILYAIGLITQRMGGRSVESYIVQMAPHYSFLESPFLAFEKEFSTLQQSLISAEIRSIQPDNLSYKQLLILHQQCLDFVNLAFKNSSKYGITLKVNQGLLCLRQQLNRVKTLLDLLVVSSEKTEEQNSIRLALTLIEFNCYKYKIRTFLKESIQVVSYEITQHTASTGEKYITETPSEYFKMLKTALGGGFIVGFMCIFKVLLSKVITSDFGHAFLYSMNYAIGFITIYLLHFTLATKQPAMTATTIIKAIENDIKNQTSNKEKHGSFARLFARLFRSQFIAFVGNIIMAFPVALFLVWAIESLTGINIVAEKWPTLLKDASPVHSPLIFHAAIAGFFLFLSGIISGNVSNKSKHHKLYYRIAENPFLKQQFGVKKTKRFSMWLENKLPGIISNFWFGIFMGSTASVGIFLGLNLDIRHITFVSGNIALASYGSHFMLSAWDWFWAILGLILVGFINFMVSFGFSLYLAFRSRNIAVTEVFSLNKAVWQHFKNNPISFFFPSKTNEIS